MNITYTQNGDYLIPNIVIRKTKPLGHYGRLRNTYLFDGKRNHVDYQHLWYIYNLCRYVLDCFVKE